LKENTLALGTVNWYTKEIILYSPYLEPDHGIMRERIKQELFDQKDYDEGFERQEQIERLGKIAKYMQVYVLDTSEIINYD
jgi:hypothetical protein